jgi:hypothetical protein
MKSRVKPHVVESRFILRPVSMASDRADFEYETLSISYGLQTHCWDISPTHEISIPRVFTSKTMYIEFFTSSDFIVSCPYCINLSIQIPNPIRNCPTTATTEPEPHRGCPR